MATKASRPKAPAANGKPLPVRTMLEEIEAGHRQDPRDNAFPEASRELFQTIVAKIRWHHEQIEMALNALNRPDPTHVVHALDEIGDDSRDMWALAELLRQAAETAR